MISRRHLLRTLAAGSLMPLPLFAGPDSRRLRLGLISDVHKDIIHDADDRLRSFVAAMKEANADAILQLGDFCIPKPANRDFLALFDAFPGPGYHVLGNHDMDEGHTREQTVAFWNMPARFYSFDLGGIHFIVLDSNDRPDGNSDRYPSFVGAAQLNWLRNDLAQTRLNTFVFSHHSLTHPSCIRNQEEVRSVLEAAKTRDGKRKVAACFNGHWHIDHAEIVRDIPYIHVNSASYFWVGGKYRRERLSPELARRHPLVASTIPYTKPLFTLLEIDPDRGSFHLHAAESAWLGPSPAEIDYASEDMNAGRVRPGITERRFGE